MTATRCRVAPAWRRGAAALAVGMALGGLAWHAGTLALEAPRVQVALAASLMPPPEARPEVTRTADSVGLAAGRGPRLTAPISTVVALRPDGLCVETIEVELRAASDLRFDRDGAMPLRIRGVAADDATLDAYIAALGRHRFLGAVEETLRHPSRCGGRGFEIELGPIESPLRPMVVHRVAGAGGGR